MIAGSVPSKLRYTLHQCSGEDPDFPARELLYHSPETRGWQSPRFCKYPQEIVLRLEFPAKIQQMQVLSHEFKIATRMDIRVGSVVINDDNRESINWKTLGHMRFDPNERSQHCARELKSVHVKAHGSFLQFCIHRCHINKQNIYNQVGILAINLIGEPLPDLTAPPGYLEVSKPVEPKPIQSMTAATAMADVTLDVNVDPMTAARIREIAQLKDAAVGREEYDEAKRLKQSIEHLKIIGQKIAALEAKKRAAVDKEDYDSAKLLKADIDKLRTAGESTDVRGGKRSNPDEIFNRVLGRKPSAGQRLEAGSLSASLSSHPEAQLEEERMMSSSNVGELVTIDKSQSLNESITREVGLSRSLSNKSKHQLYDERPAQAQGNYTETPNSSQLEVNPPISKPLAVSESEPGAIPPPPGFPPDLPCPETLNASASKKAEDLISFTGEYIASCIYSRNWQLRDAGLRYMMTNMEKLGEPGCSDRDKFLILCRVGNEGLHDKLATVFLRGVSLVQMLIEEFSQQLTARDIQHAAAEFLPILIEKTGDNNPRVRESAQMLVLFLAKWKETGIQSMTHLFLKPAKKQTAWRPLLGKLELIRELLKVFGICKTPPGFELSPLMDFVGRAFSNPNAEVRSMAVSVTIDIYRMVGPAVRKYLPKGINPKILEQLDMEINGVSNGELDQYNVKQQGNSTHSSPTRAKPTSHKHKPSPEYAPDAPDAPDAPEASEDDPALYEAEVRSREKEFGPNHPDVAESLGNLAILYNQRQEYDKAQPLLERALQIYEQTRGPGHPDVAHILTDLAVLHLEQNQDSKGRPLLQRALEIQEKHLGPNHADVLAIKDVLNGE